MINDISDGPIIFCGRCEKEVKMTIIVKYAIIKAQKFMEKDKKLLNNMVSRLVKNWLMLLINLLIKEQLKNKSCRWYGYC